MSIRIANFASFCQFVHRWRVSILQSPGGGWDSAATGDPCKVGGTYYSASDSIWFWGLGGDSTKTALATSPDGIHWTDIGMVQPNGRDCMDIPEFFTQIDPNGNGTWLYLFYAWRLESPYGDPPNYKEIRWMRKLIR